MQARAGRLSQVKVLPVAIGAAVAVGLLAGAILIDRSRTGAEDVQVVFGEQDGLPEDLKYAGRGVTTVEERDLWHMPIVLLLIAGLMAGEWAYRRAVGFA